MSRRMALSFLMYLGDKKKPELSFQPIYPHALRSPLKVCTVWSENEPVGLAQVMPGSAVEAM